MYRLICHEWASGSDCTYRNDPGTLVFSPDGGWVPPERTVQRRGVEATRIPLWHTGFEDSFREHLLNAVALLRSLKAEGFFTLGGYRWVHGASFGYLWTKDQPTLITPESLVGTSWCMPEMDTGHIFNP